MSEFVKAAIAAGFSEKQAAFLEEHIFEELAAQLDEDLDDEEEEDDEEDE